MSKIFIKECKSLSQLAYTRIKSMILHKDLMPGQIISEAQLQEVLGIGRTPVREAIMLLAKDRLLIVHPRRGIEVALPTLKDVHDIFEIRQIIEPMALRYSFSLIDLKWVKDIRELLLSHEDDDAGNTGETAIPLIELDNRFHLGLIDTLNNRYISDLMRSLSDYLNLIRVTTWKVARYKDSNHEHIAILDAILDHDLQKSCSLLIEHLQLSYQESINTMMMHTLF